MPITLAEAKVGMANKVDQQVVDEFRRSSLLLDKLVFDNAISPGTGGSTLTYGYVRLKTPATAEKREINAEYTPGEAKREEATAKAIPMGGAFEIDRVIQGTSGAVDELAFQTQQKIKATANYFHNLVINGTSAGSGAGMVVKTFDGLKKLLAGTSNEITSTLDISTSELMDTNCQQLIDELDGLIDSVDGTPSMLLMNKKMLQRVRSCARRAGYYERTEDAFGRGVDTYNGIPLMDAGEYYDKGQSKTVHSIATEEDGTSAIYAVVIGLDGFHGISPTGNKVIESFMPDMNAPGAVKKGEVELVAGVVLKNSLKAAVLKGIKIEAMA